MNKTRSPIDLGMLTDHVLKMKRLYRARYSAIPLLNRLLKMDLNYAEKIDVIIFKINEERYAGLLREAMDSILCYIHLRPLEPEPWLEITKQFRDYATDFDKAMLFADVAIAIAKIDGNFVRQAIGEKVRTSLRSKNIIAAESSLKELTSFKPKHGSIDVGWEVDFISYPEAQMLDEHVLTEYKKEIAS